jgi:hypothetical protein
MRVLITNTDKVECGVGQFGKRIYNLASRSTKVDYFYKIVPTRESFESTVDILQPEYIIWNYHWDRIPWLNVNDIKKYPEIKHYFVWHDGSMVDYYDKFLFFGYEFIGTPNTVPESRKALLPRPLFEYKGDYPKNDIVNIGSFGFSSGNKRFPQLVKLINDTFSEAVINYHITRPWFGDNHGYHLGNIIDACRKNNTNPNIKLNITTEFIDENKLLEFLAKNDINVFYYEGNPNSGLSAALDYALAVKRPVAVTRASLLRHVANENTLLENNTIQQILNKGLKPLEKQREKWSIENFVTEMDKLFL